MQKKPIRAVGKREIVQLTSKRVSSEPELIKVPRVGPTTPVQDSLPPSLKVWEYDPTIEGNGLPVTLPKEQA